jgi:hypothetical protein
MHPVNQVREKSLSMNGLCADAERYVTPMLSSRDAESVGLPGLLSKPTRSLNDTSNNIVSSSAAGAVSASAGVPTVSVSSHIAASIKLPWQTEAVLLQSSSTRGLTLSKSALSNSSMGNEQTKSNSVSKQPAESIPHLRHVTVLPPQHQPPQLLSKTLNAEGFSSSLPQGVIPITANASPAPSEPTSPHHTRRMMHPSTDKQSHGGYASHSQAFFHGLLQDAEELTRTNATGEPSAITQAGRLHKFLVHVPLTTISADTQLDQQRAAMRLQHTGITARARTVVPAPTEPVNNSTAASSNKQIADFSVCFNGVNMAQQPQSHSTSCIPLPAASNAASTPSSQLTACPTVNHACIPSDILAMRGQILDAESLSNARKLLQSTLAVMKNQQPLLNSPAFGYTHDAKRNATPPLSIPSVRGSQTERGMKSQLHHSSSLQEAMSPRSARRAADAAIVGVTPRAFVQSKVSAPAKVIADSNNFPPPRPIQRRKQALQAPLKPVSSNSSDQIHARSTKKSTPSTNAIVTSHPSQHRMLIVDTESNGAESTIAVQRISALSSRVVEPLSVLNPPVQFASIGEPERNQSDKGEGGADSIGTRIFRRPPAQQKRYLAQLDASFSNQLNAAEVHVQNQTNTLSGEVMEVTALERAHMERTDRANLNAIEESEAAMHAARMDALIKAQAEFESCTEQIQKVYASKEAALATRLHELSVQRKAASEQRVAELSHAREAEEVSELAEIARQQRLDELIIIEEKLEARIAARQARWAAEWDEAEAERERARARAERDAKIKAQETAAYKMHQYELKRQNARAGVLWVRVIRGIHLGEEPAVPTASSNSLLTHTSSLLPPATASCISISLRFKAVSLANETCWTRHFGRESSPAIEETFRMEVSNAALQSLCVAVQASPPRLVEVWERELRAALNFGAMPPPDTDGTPSSLIPIHSQLEDLARKGLLVVRSALLKDPVSLVGNAPISFPVTNGGQAHKRHMSFSYPNRAPSAASNRIIPTMSVEIPEGGEEKHGMTDSTQHTPNSNCAHAPVTPAPSSRPAGYQRSRQFSRVFQPNTSPTNGPINSPMDVSVSSISTEALSQLYQEARLRDRSEVLTRMDEIGQAQVTLISLQSQTDGHMMRNLPLYMPLTDIKRIERENKRLAVKKAAALAAMNVSPKHASSTTTMGEKPKKSSNPNTNASRNLVPSSSKPSSTQSFGAEVLRCGDVQVELLLLPLFNSTAPHDHIDTHSKRTIRIGKSELTAEEQQQIDMELEKEAAISAQTFIMPRLTGNGSDGQPRSPSPVSNVISGLRMQLLPTTHRNRAGSVLGGHNMLPLNMPSFGAHTPSQSSPDNSSPILSGMHSHCSFPHHIHGHLHSHICGHPPTQTQKTPLDPPVVQQGPGTANWLAMNTALE